MKYVDDVIRDLGISYDDIVRIFVDAGYTEEDVEEFCCNKWSDAKDMLLFEDEECFVKLAKLFGIDRDAYKWQESSNKNKFSKRKIQESRFPSAQKNFIDFVNKLQEWLDKSEPGMGLEVVEDNLGIGGAFIRIEQRDENGEIPEDGITSWMDYDDEDKYHRLLDDND